MEIVRPAKIDDSVLQSSSVAEDEAVYNPAHAYAEGDRVRGTGDLEHVVFESLQGANTGHALDEAAPLWWIRVGATNRWCMFDGSIGRQTTAADEVYTSLVVPDRIDAAVVLNVTAAEVRFTMSDAVDGVVFDQTISLVSDSGITDWWGYFFVDIERTDRVILTDLPPYAGASVSLTATDMGATVGVGEFVVGSAKHIGDTQWSPQLGVISTTVKTRDAFGNIDPKKRPSYDISSFNLNVDADYVDQLKVELVALDAVPIVWIGDPDYASSAGFGFVAQFQTVIAYPSFSLCAISFEGLT